MTLLEWWGTDAEVRLLYPAAPIRLQADSRVAISNTIELWIAQTGIFLILIRLLLHWGFNWALIRARLLSGLGQLQAYPFYYAVG